MLTRIKLLIYIAVLLIFSSAYSQDSIGMKNARHSLYFGGTRDYIFHYYDVNSDESNKYVHARFQSILNNYPNYTLRIHYEYLLKRWLSLSCGVSMSNQHYDAEGNNFADTTRCFTMYGNTHVQYGIPCSPVVGQFIPSNDTVYDTCYY